jgi:hypothetical protein
MSSVTVRARSHIGTLFQFLLCICTHTFRAWQALMSTSPELRHVLRPTVASSRSMNSQRDGLREPW